MQRKGSTLRYTLSPKLLSNLSLLRIQGPDVKGVPAILPVSPGPKQDR